MQAPEFWSQTPPGVLARLLWPAGQLYSAIAEIRMSTVSPARPLCPVVCIGNLTLGGAGKTPVAIAVARRLKTRRMKPGFLSRGYGADITKPVVVTPPGDAAAYGDEPLLLARVAPTVCSPNRPWGAEVLEAQGIDTIVMDDGFQNPTIAKDLSIVVVDSAAGIGNGQVFPSGPLRMRLAPQLARASAIVVLGSGDAATDVTMAAERRGIPVLRGILTPDAKRMDKLRGQRVFAYAGIGQPAKFFNTLRAGGADVVGTQSFADHQMFTGDQARDLIDSAKALNAKLVTTEKDAARIGASTDPDIKSLKNVSRVLPVSVAFDKVATHQLNKLLDALPDIRRAGRTTTIGRDED